MSGSALIMYPSAFLVQRRGTFQGGAPDKAGTLEVRRLALSRNVLPLIPAALQVVRVLPASDRITIVTLPKFSESACPLADSNVSRPPIPI